MWLKKLWCMIVGHKWNAYSIKSSTPYKMCNRCKHAEEKPWVTPARGWYVPKQS